ncbi:UDP-4-amino-4,6-dideoxy-N-acetyl-beta-L-altrosamine N-acetyltransferase [Saccharobesus litoralis]|uniref:UDP-4-amino-4, 6-dideoxy-N-acetyl-beta-L-altrosamine N-acetyltransferase n=1 Tax=Saccharobesus litoralis TaxID=2172099 RepID=A0A2S0VU93_9ALTE|nr:UDP-4-amino-4,6-dideoxy-N-acetyl-beta-L-altrosamine N-acetyltransferase [Saccharobesus litoralis]AWB67787.1 UDP-4-amino-4,6-dideoxy-N-acetyl-beta-L-altrosamine N-acetyltransferase [Saccharobesus litoralis]
MFEFKLMTADDLPQVLKWRTSKVVTQFMFTDIEADLHAQQQWFKRTKQDTSCCYWLIYYQEKAIGVLSINDIDVNHQSCSWGFYIGDENVRNLGGLIPPYFYNFVFSQTIIETITAEVMEHNQQVKKLHKLHGYQFIETLSQHVCKVEHYFDVDVFKLTKTAWLTKKRFAKFEASFERDVKLNVVLNTEIEKST